MAIQDIIKEYASDTQAIHDFCNTQYDTLFGTSFKEVKDMYRRMKSQVKPISDDELEYILTTFPMELIMVAENLNKIRLEYEVVRLKNKERLAELKKQFADECDELGFSKTEKQAYISNMIASASTDYQVLAAAYESIITRVEGEQSFSRELIMGAKKIWDSRRSTESVNPITPGSSELPEYKRTTKQLNYVP